MPTLFRTTFFNVFIISVWLFVVVNSAQAEDETGNHAQFRIHDQLHRTTLLIGADAAQLQAASTNFKGLGLSLAYKYSVNEKWAIRPQLGQVFDISGDHRSLYTAIGAFGDYAIMGSQLWGPIDYEFNGVSVIKVSIRKADRFSVLAGFEQLLLTGNSSLYSAPGFAGILSYQKIFDERAYGFEIKLGRYMSNDKPITGINFNVNTSLDL